MTFVVLFAGVVGVSAMVAYPRYSEARALDAQRTEVQRQIAEKERELELVHQKLRRFNNGDKEFIESLARKNRRVFPGELVFVFDD